MVNVLNRTTEKTNEEHTTHDLVQEYKISQLPLKFQKTKTAPSKIRGKLKSAINLGKRNMTNKGLFDLK